MTEEEKKAIKLLSDDVNKNPDTINLNWRRGIPELRLLLDLYNKEKEKNEKLKEENYQLTDENLMLKLLQKATPVIQLVDYVHKDKIKEKIKELDASCYAECIEFNQDVIKILKELLEE